MKPVGPSPALLQVQALRSDHGGPFDFELHAGECLAIVGRSGSGKSVLLRLVADLDPHAGQVALDGRPCAEFSAPQWRRRVVYQAAEPAWWAATASAHFSPAGLTAARPLLAALGLADELLESDITRLSTGERQRLALARSLACDPCVLLLDEPTA
ncbi:MAG: ATP-binding cassette domain-containing protein, partial [Pseudomonadota bacterium]|nr:ATP-binding cassette domain-containing protein [Pseudomonadota bacterium]